jgi:hypothetical protein
VSNSDDRDVTDDTPTRRVCTVSTFRSRTVQQGQTPSRRTKGVA